MPFYRLYDLQTGRHMATGCNTESEKELADSYIEYISVDFDDEENDEEIYRNMTVEEVLSQIKANEFIIEESEIPFEEED